MESLTYQSINYKKNIAKLWITIFGLNEVKTTVYMNCEDFYFNVKNNKNKLLKVYTYI